MDNSKIDSLKTKIESLKKQWPAHSVSPAMLQELEELEEELSELLKKSTEGDETNA